MHLWDMSTGRYPWLMEPEEKELPFAKIENLAIDYRLSEYRQDTAAIELAGFVHVEAAWDPKDPTAETRWLSSALAGIDTPYSLVAHANLLNENFPDLLAEHQSLSNRVVGIRQILNFHKDPKYTFTDNPEIALNKTWRKNFAHLGDQGMGFDLQIFADQAEVAAQLARDFSQTKMAINHFLMPIDFDKADIELWKIEMAKLAKYENIAIKLSGLYMYHRTWPKAMLDTLIDTALELFTPERTMWGSNFPVDKQFVSLEKLLADFEASLIRFDKATRDAVMWKSASAWYGLDAIAPRR